MDDVATTDGILRRLGWDERLASLLAAEGASFVPGRILAEERGLYSVASADGEHPASPSGRLRHDSELDPTAAWPAVGDWVALEPLASGSNGSGAPAGNGEHRLVQRVLPRRTAVIRRAPGDRERPSQVLAANVDVVFIVTSVNAEFNVRRLERYLTVAWESGARPVVLLSKADLAMDLEDLRIHAESAAPGVEVIGVSSVTGQGLDEVRAHLGEGRTVVFTGSSGVGKSSIVNALAGAPLLDTGGIREDDARGRHTTTRRQLVRLAEGLLIDTPGLRELGVLDGEGLSNTFEDVEALAAACRFSDCSHRSEPGCAIRAAIADGSLKADRFAAYQKLEREAYRSVLATDALARRAERKKWTAISKSVGAHMRFKYGGDG
ncbi:MAG TPA: ribosome small subunit-dependent GTPase A [Candidatus Limnocylindrales bacterium]|nr:ribosome small subunit-dependent GTPase A [Candidatus Limnocylindrales bacterium]